MRSIVMAPELTSSAAIVGLPGGWTLPEPVMTGYGARAAAARGGRAAGSTKAGFELSTGVRGAASESDESPEADEPDDRPVNESLTDRRLRSYAGRTYDGRTPVVAMDSGASPDGPAPANSPSKSATAGADGDAPLDEGADALPPPPPPLRLSDLSVGTTDDVAARPRRARRKNGEASDWRYGEFWSEGGIGDGSGTACRNDPAPSRCVSDLLRRSAAERTGENREETGRQPADP